MTLCVRTGIRIALRFFTFTQLLLCRDLNDLSLVAMLPEQRQSLHRHRRRHRLCRQVKDLFSLSFPDRSYCREQYRDGFSGPCRRLNKQILPAQDRAVHIRYQFFLSRTVRIRKFHILNGRHTRLVPLILKICPLVILLHQFIKPFFDLRKQITFIKTVDFLCVQITVSHLNTDLLQSLLQSIDICITFCLRQMHLRRFLHFCHILINAFDLIYAGNILLRKYAVGASLDREHIAFGGNIQP